MEGESDRSGAISHGDHDRLIGELEEIVRRFLQHSYSLGADYCYASQPTIDLAGRNGIERDKGNKPDRWGRHFNRPNLSADFDGQL